MRGARRLEQGRRRLTGPSAASRRREVAAPAVDCTPFIVETVGEGVAGRARDVSVAVLRALRKGEPPAGARLDLHGRTRGEALRAVESFLSRARADGHRAVLVIHGRGQNSEDGAPVLRPALAEWLAGAASARAGVMAFAPAPPRSGGSGATLVLLRR